MTQNAQPADNPPAAASPGGRVPVNTMVAERYSIGAFVRRTITAEVYQASALDGEQALHAHVIHAELVHTPDLRDAVMGAARSAMALVHPNIVRTLDTCFDGHYCVVITEPVEGNSLRDLLDRRAQSGAAGLGARGVINVMDAICDALGVAGEAGVYHGSVDTRQVFVTGDGTVRVTGFHAGALIAATVQEGLLDKPHAMAPETTATGEPSPHGDVFSLGMLMYELLIGQPLVKGGPRPSVAVPGLSEEMDKLMAISVSPGRDARPSLAQFQGGLRRAFAAPTQSPAAGAPGVPVGPADHAISVTAARATIDPALLADDEEKWLVSKGRLDYGPYSLSEVVEQIRTDQILPGSVIIDNHTGERCNVEDHPILAVIVDRAKEARDDARRANAEVVHAKQQKRRGATLYLVIAAGVTALALISYFVVTGASKDEDKAVAGLSNVGEGDFNAKISFHKKEKDAPKKRRTGRSGSGGGGDDSMVMDMGDESVGSERLDDSVINTKIQQNGGKLGGCLARNGGGYAKIGFVVAGATGRVNSVQVNGQTSGGLYNCINKVMRGIKFPTFDGQRTRAEFDMEI